MGLSIHYSGKLRNTSELPLLIEEAIDIAKSLNWHYERLPHIPDIPIDGILITPEGSEPLWLTFHTEGYMCNPLLYSFVLETEGQEIPANAVTGMFTKTQYAGVEAHMAMIKFLRYLSSKYFEIFELQDESQYWETGDESICRKRFDHYNHLMDIVGNALDEMKFDPDESKENIVSKIEAMLSDRFGMRKKD